MSLATEFYQAFSHGRVDKLSEFYHQDLVFNDPIFTDLDYRTTLLMWEMLFSRATDMKVEFRIIKENEEMAIVNWVATYPFSKTGNVVVNDITAMLIFKDQQIIGHTDNFDFKAWSKMALGYRAFILPQKIIHKSVSKQACKNLNEFIIEIEDQQQ